MLINKLIDRILEELANSKESLKYVERTPGSVDEAAGLSF